MAIINVVGSSPISFTDSGGGQQFVPLSALQFSGSTMQLKSSWSPHFDVTETTMILELAKARAAAQEIVPPQVPPPLPALLFSATHPGVESNNIAVSVAVDAGSPLAATMTISAVETDTYEALASAAAAALAIGVDTPSGNSGDPVAGTGLAVIKADSVSTGTTLPVASSGQLTSAGYDVKDNASTKLFTILPRADFPDNGALSIDVSLDAAGTTFTITVTYDSTVPPGQAKVTLLSLSTLPAPVAYLVGVTSPPGGAALPKPGSVQLAGGGAGISASGVIYTS